MTIVWQCKQINDGSVRRKKTYYNTRDEFNFFQELGFMEFSQNLYGILCIGTYTNFYL